MWMVGGGQVGGGGGGGKGNATSHTTSHEEPAVSYEWLSESKEVLYTEGVI